MFSERIQTPGTTYFVIHFIEKKIYKRLSYKDSK